MTPEQNGLKIFEEELGELAVEILTLQQQVSKAIRFGINEQRDLPTTNRERIESEWNDLLGSLQNLSKVGIDLKPDLNAVSLKMAKIKKYTEYGIKLGTVQPENSVQHCWEGGTKETCDCPDCGSSLIDYQGE